MKKIDDKNKEMHHIHDKSYKDLYSKKEIALDLFKNMIKEDWAKEITVENLSLVNKSFVTSDYEETECDIVYQAKIKDTEIFFYILLEFQSTVDYRMPLRLLFYMCEILRDYSKNANHKKYDKNLKIPAIIPIVLYNGQEVWQVPREFRKIIYNEKMFKNSLLNFQYDLIDINNGFTEEELIKSKNVSAAIFLLDQKIDAIQFLQRIKAIAIFFDALSEVEMRAIKHWIKNTIDNQLAESAIKILESKREDVEVMVANNMFILTEFREKAEKEGLQKGLEQGVEQGIEQGLQQGDLNRKIKSAKNLLPILDDKTIASTMELDIEVVKNLEKKVIYNIKENLRLRNTCFRFFLIVFIIFIGLAIAILSGALSYLVEKASNIKEENDLTI